ncbi:hypothetical protein C4J81_05965 [Deltaproteobacteria bacterium Smac51]|nr:hypothetical protein C4J81_05965 [Deltaproteobacteria bacterium Smac51]
MDIFEVSMKKLNEYYSAALKAVIKSRPRGFRTELALDARVNPSQVSDIVHGRRYGSEETRRTLVEALGWDYEDFLRYGQCLLEGREYVPPSKPKLAFDEVLYTTVPHYNRLARVPGPGGQIWGPEPSDELPPLVARRDMLYEFGQCDNLAAFRVLDDSMEPTIDRDSVVIVNMADRSPADDRLFLLGLSDEPDNYIVRRVRISGGDCIVAGDNLKYLPQAIRGGWPGLVVGRVLLHYTYHM